MFERQERTAILLLAGVAVTVIAAHLILAGMGKQPFARPFSHLSADGELVVVEGEIDQIILTKSGGHLLLNVSSVPVFIPGQAAQGLIFRKGDQVTIYGTVQTYQGKKEIIVDAPGDIRIIPAVKERISGM